MLTPEQQSLLRDLEALIDWRDHHARTAEVVSVTARSEDGEPVL